MAKSEKGPWFGASVVNGIDTYDPCLPNFWGVDCDRTNEWGTALLGIGMDSFGAELDEIDRFEYLSGNLGV